MINDLALAIQAFVNDLIGLLNDLLAFLGIQIEVDPLDCIGEV